MIIREYQSTDCIELAELFYNTVHTVNAKDYTKEQLDVWATGQVLADKFLKGIDLQEIREVVLMTRLGQMIYDDGMEKGVDRMSLLTSRLLKENRLDDLQKAVEDKKYCEQLLKEYGIE